MKPIYKIVLFIALSIYVLDQYSKWLIVEYFPIGSRRVIFDSFFDIVHARNRGAAFGILSSWDSAYRDVFFYILSVFALLFLLQFMRHIPSNQKSWALPIGLVLGGAFGNISDRILRGSVVDFLSVHWNNESLSFDLLGRHLHFDLTWPAFNVADSAITIGVIWLMIIMTFLQPKLATK